MQQKKNEFSYPVEVARIPSTSMKVELSASKDECEALAARFGLPAVHSFNVSAVLKAIGKDRVRVSGRFKAEITQTCVVSLEPFDAEVSDSFSVLFCNEKSRTSLTPNEIDLDFSEEEETDEIENGKIDVAELAAEYFSLALDPFPKRPGAEFSFSFEGEKPENPFQALEKLKKE